MSAARDFTARRFGALTTPRITFVDVDAQPLEVRPNNPNCLLLFITNIGTSNINLSYRPDSSANPMFLLIGNGSAFLSRVDLDGDVVGYTIYASSDVPGGRIAVSEIVQEVVTLPEGE